MAKRRMSAEGRARIVMAQSARWAKVHSANNHSKTENFRTPLVDDILQKVEGYLSRQDDVDALGLRLLIQHVRK